MNYGVQLGGHVPLSPHALCTQNEQGHLHLKTPYSSLPLFRNEDSDSYVSEGLCISLQKDKMKIMSVSNKCNVLLLPISKPQSTPIVTQKFRLWVAFD